MNELDIPSIILAEIEETRVRVVEHHTNENETKQQMKKVEITYCQILTYGHYSPHVQIG